MSLFDHAVCSECHRTMLSGVPSIEPPFFCPEHPDGTPLLTQPCPSCGGKGWHFVTGVKQLEFQARLERIVR